jgi:putative salt-induced outer membrane protein YdiY
MTAQATAALLVAVMLAGSARGDEILFRNGDRWTGKLISMEDGKMKIDTELAGPLEVDASRVMTFRTDEPIEIHQSDGTVFVDSIDTEDAGTVRTRGAGAAGERLVVLQDTVAINPQPPEVPGWEGSALAGAKFERGNTIKDEAYVDLKVAYEIGKSRIALRGTYDGERTTDRSTGVANTNDRNIFGRILYDYYFGEKWFWWTGTSAEKDGPSNLDLRFMAGAGLGYKFWDRKNLKLYTRLGPAFVREDFRDSSSGDEERVSAIASWDFSWKLSPVWSYFNDGSYLQSLEDADVGLLKLETGLRGDITEHIFFEGKILYEWDSETASDAERQDVDYILGVGYKFD